MMNGVLSGVRVLDFGRYIAGPYCATLLAEFGADVIRIEKRSGGEDRFQAPLTESREGALYMQVGRNKRGMTLDPMKPECREVVRRLVETADVATATGIAGMFGYLGGALFTLTVGALASTLGYEPLFAMLFLFDIVAALVLWAFIGVRAPKGLAQPAV